MCYTQGNKQDIGATWTVPCGSAERTRRMTGGDDLKRTGILGGTWGGKSAHGTSVTRAGAEDASALEIASKPYQVLASVQGTKLTDTTSLGVCAIPLK